MNILWLDRETFSELDLKEVGTYLYAEHAEDLIVTYAINDDEVQAWDVTADPYCPDDLQAALEDPSFVVICHNCAFDKAIHRHQTHLPQPPLERWQCTMAMALSHALPASLGELGRVLGLPSEQQKDKDGKRLIRLFTRPQPKNRKVRRATRLTHPEDWAKFISYAKDDVVAMRACYYRMPKWNWNASAIAEWHLDQRMNERGFRVDTELTKAGVLAAETEKARIGVRFRELTMTIVDRPSQREQFMAFLNQMFDLNLEDTQSETFRRLIDAGGLHPTCVELMELAMMANKTSTAKYAKLDPMVQSDGRFRGGLQFAGASRTRRWAGRGPQYHNLPARGLPATELVSLYVEHLKNGTHDLFFGDLMKYGSAALRHTVIAEPGRKLVVADLSNIEGRMLSWLAQEHWKLQAFRDFDAGTGPDLYKVTASIITGIPAMQVPKSLRNSLGKVSDLASGYMGGVSGYQTFAHAYGVVMADYWGVLQEQVSAGLIEKAKQNLEKWGREQLVTLEIDEIEWLASETCKLAWRERHPATVSFWYNLQRAVKAAITNQGTQFSVAPFLKVKCVKFLDQTWLVIQLPSGRYLTYFEPHLLRDGTICYWGDASEEGKTTRQWIRCFTHGGKITGNCVAADTLVVTQSGLVPITDITPSHQIWDGEEWVTCEGVLAQGKKAVGEWLKVKITQDHLIHDGSSWKPVMQLDAAFSRAALASAASSVLSPSFAVTPQTAAMQTAAVNAALSGASTTSNCGGVRACDAKPVPALNARNAADGITTSSQTTDSATSGLTATSTWSAAVSSPRTQRTATTVAGVLRSTALGSLAVALFLSTSRHWTAGTKRVLTWIAKTTTATTRRATSDWSADGSIPTTPAPIVTLNTAAASGQQANSGNAIAPSGRASVQSPITSISAEAQNGLWAATTESIEVFDLLNCGPRSRFTIMTAAGPVVVHNCCQTISRDVLMSGLTKAEAKDYTPILSVHDEAITSVLDTPEFNAQGLVDILAENDPWNIGLPLSAAGFESYHYLKD